MRRLIGFAIGVKNHLIFVSLILNHNLISSLQNTHCYSSLQVLSLSLSLSEVLFIIDHNKLRVFFPPNFSNAVQIDICELVYDESCGFIRVILQPDQFSLIIWTDTNMYLLERDGISVISVDFGTLFFRSDSDIVIFFNESLFLLFIMSHQIQFITLFL